MKRANGTGGITKLSGNRRKPWRASTSCVINGIRFKEDIGCYATREEALQALEDYNKGFTGSNVYFISDGEFVKIGKANNVQVRLSQFQTASPRPLKVLKVIECKDSKDAYELEKFLHQAFSEHHIRNEWFDIKTLI